MPWSGTASAGRARGWRSGSRACARACRRARRSPRSSNGAPSSRAASLDRRRSRPARGCASRRRSRRRPRPASTTRVSNAVLRAQQRRRRRCARWPKRKFSPTDTCVAPSCSTSTWSMNSCGVCAANAPSNGITTSSSTPSAGDQVGLLLERGQQLRRRLGRDDRARVRLERQHGVGAADHLAVAEVHAVELADRQRGAAVGVASGSQVTSISRGSLRRA